MTSPAIYKRPPFPNRPWITGKVYDDYSRTSILHCDAFVFEYASKPYLVIDWREGGFKRVALDGYLIELDGLTPVWDIEPQWGRGKPRFWSRANHGLMSRIHAQVLLQPARMLDVGRGRWARVVVQAHYVRVHDADTEIRDGNAYTERKPYGPRRVSALPDWL